MAKKRKPANGTAADKTISEERLKDLYPALCQGTTAAERRMKSGQEALAQGSKPMTAEEFDSYVAEFKDLWPDDEIDAFVAWMHRGRQLGKSD